MMPAARTFIGFALALITIVAIDRLLVESIVVISSSMNPTILANERMFLNRNPEKLNRFDVVVIDSKYLGHRVIKRIIGLPNDCISLQDSFRVRLNGKMLPLSPAKGLGPLIQIESNHHAIQLVRHPKISYWTKFGDPELCIRENRYYVLGDNRLASGDSRDFASIGIDEIQGVVSYIWYSFDLNFKKSPDHVFYPWEAVRWERIGIDANAQWVE